MSSIIRAASNAIPSKLKPVLLVFLNLALATGLSYLANPWIGQDIMAVERPMTTLNDYMGVVGWRIVEVLGYWIGGWDASQAACLVTLTLSPALHYLHTYQPSHSPLLPTLAVTTAIDVLSIYLPLRFLRASPKNSTARPFKQDSKTDATRFLTTLLSSGIYQLVLYSAGRKFLTSWLLTSGWDLESVVRVHDAPEAVLLARALMMMPVGWAASEIIFYSPNGSADSTIPSDPAPEEIKQDYTGVWGFFLCMWMNRLSPRSRKIIKRTLLIASYQGISSVVDLAGTVKGGDLRGAVGVSGVWAAATMIVGAVLCWVGRV
ncbi:hypothetical protein L873DRAFT_1827873 [Choiromyces venosus 120613-1]|uniref:Uncharacterized protein n=1 Tax=Choiromyces venosus 120613-1 TaxID=1336337 RepID=A0A3N4JNA4_9PEZI|nr:hypothetical protein L873DRAFT_1827873 [Choiromyces venosus 120613-1]